jgi:hypothetical protein
VRVYYVCFDLLPVIECVRDCLADRHIAIRAEVTLFTRKAMNGVVRRRALMNHPLLTGGKDMDVTSSPRIHPRQRYPA